MNGQSARLAKSFAAIAAFERLLLRVNVTVEIKGKKTSKCVPMVNEI